MPTNHGSNDASTPTPTTPAGPLRQWRVLLGTADGTVELRTGITACTAAEVLDYLDRTIDYETLLGIFDVTPHDTTAPPPADFETATTAPRSSQLAARAILWGHPDHLGTRHRYTLLERNPAICTAHTDSFPAAGTRSVFAAPPPARRDRHRFRLKDHSNTPP